ncbi:MAG: hypothetical protein FWF59_05370 [Turicibacter sp.]|nr:hypothetical protein [Turicibacter sp.]
MKVSSPKAALDKLVAGNAIYTYSRKTAVDVSREKRWETAVKGQEPYAVVVTCSDSRVPCESVFNAGIGELFVIRTAGNVVGDFELGSIEYAIANLDVPLIVVMGHTKCGAVTAALEGEAEGYICAIIQEIKGGLVGGESVEEGVYKNSRHSIGRIYQSPKVCDMISSGKVGIVCAEYDNHTGHVTFFDEC